ncbi:MAG: hypothetical protein IJ633_01720 [Prevotella sp.]|nr:hypothetical protein [Prevotella sp.]
MSSRTNLLQTILTSPRTVFNVQSLMMMTGSDDNQRLTKSLHYYVADGKILNPRRGIYTKLKYNEQEMACSLFRPSYISLEYVLGRAGVIFQWDDTISSISYLSRQIEIDGRQYLFRKINPELWIGMEGIEQRDNVAMASAERAFLDMVYLSAGNCYFDNLHPLSIKKIRELLPLYRSPILNERVARLMNIKL